MLPGTDGLELVRTLRRLPATARLPIVLLTARAGSDSAAEGFSAGADDYVTKPFDPLSCWPGCGCTSSWRGCATTR